MIIRRSKKEPAAECSETRRALEAKHERQRMRERKTESILDMLKGIGDLNVEDVLLDSRYRERARELGDSLKNCPGAVGAADAIERAFRNKEN